MKVTIFVAVIALFTVGCIGLGIEAYEAGLEHFAMFLAAAVWWSLIHLTGDILNMGSGR